MVAVISLPGGVYVPSLDERVAMHLEDGTYDLVVCPNVWALRRRVVDMRTGESRRTRCNLWSCPYCGPRKVNEWRQLIAEAQPTLHLVLTKAGRTVEEAARALTTFMQALRRGSKGRGKQHVGARAAYPVEYFGVLERHSDFEENGFHWHLLLRGVDFIPYEEVVRPLWTSAVFGKDRQHLREETVNEGTGEISQEMRLGWIRPVKNARAIGYVTKYLMKDIVRGERGVRQKRRNVVGLAVGESGLFVEDRGLVQEEEESRARRIRYSRGFFPEPVGRLRRRLFAGASPDAGGEADGGEEAPSWELREVCPVVTSSEAYDTLLRYTLKEEVADRVANGRRLSRRVVSVWNYQREVLS